MATTAAPVDGGGVGQQLAPELLGGLPFNETQWNVEKFYYAAGLYFPFLVVFIYFTVFFTLKHKVPRSHYCTRTAGGCVVLELKSLLPQLVAGILSTAFVIRFIWCFVEAAEYASNPYYNTTASGADFTGTPLFYVERVLNRLSMLLLLTAFSLVLLGWLLSAGGSLADWNKCFRITFVVLNIFVYIVTLATAMSSSETHVYSVNGLIVATVMVVLGVGYIVVGIKCVGTRLRAMSQSELVMREYRRVLVTTLVCTACFLLQAVLWILGLAMNHDQWGAADAYVYPWLFYCVPEIVPGMAIILLLCFQSRQMSTSSAGGGGTTTMGYSSEVAGWGGAKAGGSDGGESRMAGADDNETPFLVGALAAAERYSSRYVVAGQPAEDLFPTDIYSSINSTQSGSEFN